MKISVYKTKHVLVVAQHAYDREIVLVRYFVSESTAADFIEQLASE